MKRSRSRSAELVTTPGVPRMLRRTTDPVIVLSNEARRLYPKMAAAYDQLDTLLRECPHNDPSIAEGQAQADALGRQYEQLCEQICTTEVRSLEGVLAKLRCAVRCIQDTVPPSADPALTCDIELRLVLALERDVARLLGTL